MKLFSRIAVFLLAILQPISSALSNFSDDPTFTSSFITPAPYTFLIWGVIVAGCLVYGIYQLLPRAIPVKLYDDIAPHLSIVFLGFVAWLYAADRGYLFATLSIFIVMGIFLHSALTRIQASANVGALSLFERIFVRGTVSAYYGWTSIAIFANVATVAAYYGMPVEGTYGMLWQFVILIAAFVTAWYGISGTKVNSLYFLAVLWAFVGITVGTVQVGVPALPLVLLSMLATLTLLLRYIRLKRKKKAYARRLAK